MQKEKYLPEFTPHALFDVHVVHVVFQQSVAKQSFGFTSRKALAFLVILQACQNLWLLKLLMEMEWDWGQTYGLLVLLHTCCFLVTLPSEGPMTGRH